MYKIVTLLLLQIALFQTAYSQGCVPDPNPQPGPSCQDAPFLCCGEVDGLSGTLPVGPNVNGPTPLCPGTSTVANNIEWVSFAAGSTSVTLELLIDNCVAGSGGNGVQVGIYSDCDFANSIFCNGGQNIGVTPVNLNNLVIGEVYHMFIDGFSGSVCDYAFTVTSGSTFAPEPSNPVSITGGALSVCEGAPPQTYSAPLGANSSLNYWEITPGDVTFNDNGGSITVTDWGSAVGGSATICVQGLNDCYLNPTGINPTCITVQVNPDQMQLANGDYCQEEGGYIFPPNGQSYSAGVWPVTVPDPAAGLGCDIIYELTVNEFIPVDLDSSLFLCPGEAYVVNGTPYFPPIAGLAVPFGVDDNFCQRTLNLTLSVIDTVNTIVASPGTVLDCDNPNILLTAVINNFNPEVTYYYEWNTDDGFFVSTSNEIAVVNQPGIYTVDITMEAFDDRGLVVCEATQSFIEITANTSGPDVSDTDQTPASCGTGNNGTATVNPVGGASPYTILWDAAANNQATNTATGLAPGVYSVTVTDANLCDNITTVEVFATPVVSLDQNPTIVNVNCINELTGSATVVASGGTGTIDYTWDINAGAQSGPVATGLAAGTYSVTASDPLGCQDVLTVTITQPATAIAGVVDAVSASACGQATGSIDITPSGGTAPYNYLWSDTSIDQDLTNAAAAAYEVTVTDDLGCSIVLNSSIPNADGPSIDSINVTDVDCFGNSTGELELVISGGAMPYIIDWDAADDVENPGSLAAGVYNVLVTDQNNCNVTGTATINQPDVLAATVNATQSNCDQATGSLQLTVTGGVAISTYDWDLAPDVEDPTGLEANTYTVLVTDVNGCQVSAMGTITEPDAPLGTSTHADVSCFGDDNGSVSINITSGSGGYQYDWGDPLLNDNASNGNLAPGTYNVVVTDAANCSVSFTEEVVQPTEITATIDPSSTLCYGDPTGSALVTPSGGVGTDYDYNWCNSESTAQAIALSSGPCTVVVTDETGCSESFDTNIPEAPLFESTLISVTDLPCFENGQGAIDIQINGGTGTLEFDWTGATIPNTTEDPSGLDAGIYEVVVTDQNNCSTEILNIVVDQAAPLLISGTTDDATCGFSNGSIDTELTGGTGNIDYVWTPTLPNAPDHNQTLATGSYDLVITDENGCQETASYFVDTPPALEVVDSEGSALLCFGDNNGTVSVEINGGSGIGTYEFDWGGTYPDVDNLDNLVAGTYDVVVTDDDGCTIDATAEVTQPQILNIDLVVANNPSCENPDGSIEINVSGGTISSDYNFDWNTGAYSTQNISPLPEGVYDLVVTDENNCSTEASYTLAAPETFEPAETNVDVTCNTFDDGIIDVTNTNGSGDFSYAWSDPVIGDTPNASGLAPGFYDVTITDNVSGCIEEIQLIEITQPAAINATVDATVDATCLNNDGSIDATVTGGFGGFQYSWNGPGVINDPSQDLSNLESGDYVLDILDQNNCPSTLMVTIGIPTPPTISGVPTAVLCNGGTDGTIQATTDNPNGAVSYAWSDPLQGDTDLATGLAPGVYTATVTDALNCTAELVNIVIDEPTAIDVQSIGLETDCDVDNGSIDLTVTGGVGNYTYDWLDIADVEDPSGLGQGTYYVTVFDDNDCPAETSVVIDQPLPAVVTSATVPANCFNDLNGSIDLDVVGTNAPYYFNWTGTPQIVEDPVGLGAGIYSVIVSDDDGCTTAVTNIEITQPDLLAFTFTTDDASCNLPNGTIDVEVTGGTGNIDYNWTPSLPNQPDHIQALNSGTYELEIIDENGCESTQTIEVYEPNPLEVVAETGSMLSCNGDNNGTASVQIMGGTGVGTYTYNWGSGYPDLPMIDGLPIGTYPVEVTDEDGCIINAVAVVDQPSPVVITLSGSTDPSCAVPDGTIDISVSGGTSASGDYTYDWNLGTYFTQDISNLGSGTYAVTVMDDNNCPAEASFSIQAPGSFTAAQTTTDITCNSLANGSIDVSTTAGSGDFTFNWSDPTIGDTPIANNLTPGFYEVTIVDNQTGCENTIFSVEVEEPDAIAITGVPTDPTCLNNNGAINATVLGGTGNINYTWTGPNTSEITEDLTNLEEGQYILNVTDGNGCPQSETFNINMPADPTLNATPTDALCFNDASGIITATGSSPNGMLSYTWSDPNIGNTNLAENLPMGIYNVTVTDPLDCTAEVLNINIDQPTPVDVQFVTTDSDCDVDNGTIDLLPTGGVGNYTFDWEDLPDTQDQLAVGAGLYTVTVYDGNDCPAIVTVPVDVPQAADVTFATTNVPCYNGTTGSIDLTVVGTNGPYQFTWTGTNQNVEDPTNLPAGTYSVVVSDLDGCDTPIAGIEIVEGTEITSTSDITPALCGADDGSISLTVNGGSMPYSYDWGDPNIGDTPDPDQLSNGTYIVTITDNVGCTFTDTYSVIDPSGVQLQPSQVDILCNGGNNGSAIVDIQSGIAPITVSWSSPVMPNIPDGTIAENLVAGAYAAVVTDGNGCTTTLNFNIDEPAVLTSLSQSSLNISCFGFSDGAAVAQPVGGTAPYTYNWNNNAGNQQEIFNLSADIEYVATITDDNGCTYESPALVLGQPDELILDGDPSELLCNGGSDAAIQLSITGGNVGSAINYDWSDNQFDGLDMASGLSAGTYSVTASDIENCTDEITVVIDDPVGMEVTTADVSNFDGFNVTCYNSEDGYISLNTTGGTGNITYLWDDPAGTTSSTVSEIGQGTFNVTVTDANGCTTEFFETLNAPEEIQVDLEAVDVRCNGDANGVLVVTETQGGASPFMYGIDNGPLSSGGVFNNLAPGSYSLMAEDVNGCQKEEIFDIEEPDSLTVSLGDDIEIPYGDSVTLTPSVDLGGAVLASLTWGNESILCPDGNCINLNVQPEVTTNYRVIVVDENGCEHEDMIQVRVRKDRNVYIPNAFNPNSADFDNSTFQIFTGPGVTMIEDFMVVDRWGEIVFRIPEAFDPNVGVNEWGWKGDLNGKDMNPGVYVYYAKVRFLDDEVLEYAGDVTLLK